MLSVRITGLLTQGEALRACEDVALLPTDLFEAGESLYRLAGPLPDFELVAGDLLVVAPRPRGTAATGELVIATLHERAFVGRWWAKHARRALLDSTTTVIVEHADLRVVGAVTLIVRDETR